MPRFRTLPACLALLGVLLAAGAAQAQSVTISNKQSLLRLTPDGKTVTKRQINRSPFSRWAIRSLRHSLR